MIVALLVLIVLILLFGAGVVKGWLANAATMGCGFVAILLALMWVGSFFGENGFRYVLLVLGGILLLLALVAAVFKEQAPEDRPAVSKNAGSTPRPPPPAKPTPAPEQPAIDRVWGWFAGDIALRFSPEARAKAYELYNAGNAHGLDRFCREEIRRLK